MAVDIDRSIARILGDIADHVERIMRAEFRLARMELGGELRRLQRASIVLAAGVVAVTLAMAFVLLAIVYALSTVMTPFAAALLVGVVTAAIGLICVTAGWKRLHGITLPRTAARLQENFQWTKTRAT